MNDSLMYLKKLEAVGIPRAQAEVQVEIMTDVYDRNLATKQDMAELRAATKQDMAEMRSATTKDMGELRSELKGEIAELRSEFSKFRTDIDHRFEVQNDKLTIRLSFVMAGLLAAAVTLGKLF